MRPVRTVIAIIFAAIIAATGCTAHSAAVQPATPSPSTTAPLPSNPPQPPPTPPTTTFPLGRIQRLAAVQAIGDSGVVWAAGRGTILTTSNGGRSWARVWRGTQELGEVDFVNTSTGWALGDGVLLGTIDGGQHWRRLGQPRPGPLRRVHFSSPAQGWGVAAGTGQPGQGPQGATTLVHTSNGGRTWSGLAAPAPPQSVCFTGASDGWVASGTSVWRSVDGGHHWGPRPSFTLPAPTYGLPAFAELQCARPGAAWVRFDAGDAAAGHIPYALYTTRDGGAHWRGVLGEPGTLGSRLGLPAGPGNSPGPFSVIDPSRAVLLSPTPAAEATGAVLITQAGRQLQRLTGIPHTTLSTISPSSVSFASTTHGWVVGTRGAGQAVILATTDGGHSWHSQLPT